ncbi:MAG: hypothetical protein MUP76_03735 [Acidimicrobiia bacterium]|nr:hypothetical protein [Acidimicrobiia bacterium]
MRRLVCSMLILVLLGAPATAAATMPPPPIRLGGVWAASHPCSSPMPMWMLATRCGAGPA